MDWWLQVAIILGMFILRLGVPLLITLAIGYWLRRLDARWQAEALAQREANRLEHQEATEPALKGVNGIEQPCWVLKGCPETVRARCPAFRQPEAPCWLVRLRVEGRLPAGCYACELFARLPISPHQLN